MPANQNPQQLEMFNKYKGNQPEDNSDNESNILHKQPDRRKLVIGAIIFIVVNLLSFSFGVERGLNLVKSRKDGISHSRQVPLLNNEVLKEQIEEQAEKQVEAEIDAKYSIQVASYRTIQKAEGEIEVLKNKGYDSFLIKKGDYIAVCVGKFQNKEDAYDVLKKLKKIYADSYIRGL